MIYSFDGSRCHPNREEANNHLVHFESGLSDEELDAIVAIGDELATTNVKLFGKTDPSRVQATGSHFALTEETRWIYQRMALAARQINEQNFQFNLNGFAENFYYLSYGDQGDHFDWHLDIGYQTQAPRKMSLVLQLSHPEEYEGGFFDVLVAHQHFRAIKQRGMIVAFPAFKIHRVTPVTAGVRKTLAMFTTGPNFR